LSTPEPKGIDVDRGLKLGKYEILRKLAVGGMAEIFLARASGLPGFEKMVVVKRILPQLAVMRDFVEMFLDEARIAATLQHANVVQVYDVGVVDQSYFMAMEYLHGEDVRCIMSTLLGQGKKLPIEHAINIMIGACAGLHYAHEKIGFDGRKLEIVHRDMSPQNVIVTYDGGVKVLDFGIAKASNRVAETRAQTLKGKIPYMSPEQCRGERLDRRSDIFALGIMLYEISVGRRLYKGRSDFEVLKQIVEGRIAPPRELDPAYPPALEAIVMKALEKSPAARFQTARELQVALETLSRQEHLYLSQLSLAQFMEQVFGQRIEAWREAQSKGKSLGEHLEERVIEALEPGEFTDETEALLPAELKVEQKEGAEFLKAIARTAEPAGRRTRRYALMGILSLLAAGGAGLAAWGVGRALAPKAPIAAPPPVAAPVVAVAPPPVAPQPVVPSPVVVAPSPSAPPPAPPAPRPTSRAAAASHARIAPRAPAPAAEGTLVIGSTPWCTVKVDGVDKGPTPVSVKVAAGKHVVVLSNPEFKIVRTLPVSVAAGETVRKKLDFTQ
jgi:serine/threonine protein kinase